MHALTRVIIFHLVYNTGKVPNKGIEGDSASHNYVLSKIGIFGTKCEHIP